MCVCAATEAFVRYLPPRRQRWFKRLGLLFHPLLLQPILFDHQEALGTEFVVWEMPPAVAISTANTKLSVPRAAAGLGALDDDVWETPRANPIYKSLKFTEWEVPAAPGLITVARYELGGLLLASMDYQQTQASKTALLAADILTYDLPATAASQMVHAMANAKLFEDEYETREEFLAAVAASTTLDRTHFKIDGGTAALTDPFSSQGRNPYAGPPELAFLTKVSWFSMLREGFRASASRPADLLGRLFHVLGSKARHVTRADEDSQVRTTSDLLRSYVATFARAGADASDSVVAVKLPSFMAACCQQLLAPMRAATTDSAAQLEDLTDGMVMLTGRSTEVSAALWRRAYERVRDVKQFPALSAFTSALTGVAAFRVEMTRLTDHFCAKQQSGDPFASLGALDAALTQRNKRQEIVDLVAAGSSISQIITTIIQSAEASGGSSSGHSAPVGDGEGLPGALADSSLTAARTDRATSAKTFRDTVQACKTLSGVEFMERCFRSGSAILMRFLVDRPAWLRPKHDFFDDVAQQLSSRRAYFSKALVMDEEDGEVPALLNTFTYPDSEVDLFLRGKWLEMDCPNKGFLAIRGLEHGTHYNTVTKNDFYVVESCLLGHREFFPRLLDAVKYPTDSDEGHSYEEVIDAQLSLVRYIQGLPQAERVVWMDWARTNFEQHALGHAADNWLNFKGAASPADAALECFLPDTTEFFQNIKNRRAKAEPIAIVRQALPSLFSSGAITLPGCKHPGGHTKDSDGEDEDADAGGSKKKPKGKKMEKVKGKRKADGKGLAVYLDAKTLFLAGRVYDLEAIAAKYNVKVKDKCWPVLLSTKEGDAKLGLCLHPDTHGGLDDKAHTPPQNFDRAAVASEFSQPASAEQLKKAGWTSTKKTK